MVATNPMRLTMAVLSLILRLNQSLLKQNYPLGVDIPQNDDIKTVPGKG
jgi:uncharacterized membrane protein